MIKAFYWSAGVLTGAAWSIINFLLLVVIMKAAMVERNRKKVLWLLLIKFPVVYLVGFFILVSRVFPPISLLAGASGILLAIGALHYARNAYRAT